VDFSLSAEQEAVQGLARKLFSERCSDERTKQLERGGPWWDAELWAEVVKTNLAGLALPEDVGGSGLTLLEVALVLEELGRHLAPVPLFPSLVLGGLPLAAFGSPAQRQRWLLPAAGEGLVLSAALVEAGSADPARPQVTARRDGADYRLDGVKECVPAGTLAGLLLVPARTAEGVGVFLVEASAPGVALAPQLATHHEPQARLELDGARVGAQGVLRDAQRGAEIVEWVLDRALVGLCAIQLGVAEEALRRTAEYTKARQQFGRPIAAFQGVALRAADAYIDLEAMRSTLLQAAWRVSAGLPARAEIAAAKWWACRGGQRIVHTAQHLHAGIGADIDYPIHRFFLWSKHLDLMFGGASRQLARLGALLVADPQAEGQA
jgi:alkylation response protein AidB-like acyl-CoA dehydrogenase